MFNSLIYDPKKFFTASLAVFFALPVLLVGLAGHSRSQALTINSPRDCDDNAVIRCGALNFTELENRSSQAGAMEIFSAFGISAQDISNIENTAVEGIVTKNNNVWIHRSSGLCPEGQPTSQEFVKLEQANPNLCLVGTDAMTAGRQNISGSSASSQGGVNFFQRPPSVSFVSSSLPAFVVMSGGHLQFAIIASCGNPVIATPVTHVSKPKPVPQPQPKQPPAAVPPQTTTPAAPATTTVTNNNTNNNSNTNVNNNNVTVQAPPAAPPAEVTQAVAPQPVPPQQVSTPVQPQQPAAPAAQSSPQVGKTLPNTGPANVVGLTALTTLAGTVGHLLYNRRRW